MLRKQVRRNSSRKTGALVGLAGWALIGALFVAPAGAFGQAELLPSQTSSDPAPAQPSADANTGDAPSLISLPRAIAGDQKTIWSFPIRAAEGKHWKPALAVTLATLALYRGLAQILLGDHSLSQFPQWFVGIDRVTVPGTPIPVVLIIFFVLAIVLGLILHKTVFGRWVYALGTSEDAARYSGVPVDRVRLNTSQPTDLPGPAIYRACPALLPALLDRSIK